MKYSKYLNNLLFTKDTHKKTVISASIISVLLIVFILSLTINKIQLDPQTDAGSSAYQSKYGKGVIHYTENYIRNYDFGGNIIEKPPVPEAIVSTIDSKYIEGVECSRYLDMTNQDIELFKQLGLKHIIVGFGPASWYNIATRKPDNAIDPEDKAYNFTKLDEWVEKLSQNGFIVVLQLWGTPTWESGVPSPRAKKVSTQLSDCKNRLLNPYSNIPFSTQFSFEPYNNIPKNNKDYADFVEAVAKRYKGKVNSYSLWNEPNLVQFNKNGSIDAIVDLNNQAYERLKAVDKSIDVWGANLSGNYSNVYGKGGQQVPEAFLKNTDGKMKFDTFSIHAYPIDFNQNPNDSVGNVSKGLISISNIENAFKILDENKYQGKPVIVSEFGFRSNIEMQYGYKDLTTNISEKLKALYMYTALQNLNRQLLLNPSYLNRFKGIANNTLYNAWRWWSTGLIEMFDPSKNQLSFDYKLPSFHVFANWDLPNLAPINRSILSNTSSKPPFDANIFYPNRNGFTVIKNDTYWYKSYSDLSWNNAKLNSIYSKSTNFAASNVPSNNIDAAYFDLSNGYTIIKGDRYWYRTSDTAPWYTNTLAQAYRTGNWQSVNVPISNIDTAYYDFKNGAYTVIKGGNFWYRPKGQPNWVSGTLKSVYYNTSNNLADKLQVPTENLTSAYFDLEGGYTIIKDQKVWYRVSGTGIWNITNLNFETIHK